VTLRALHDLPNLRLPHVAGPIGEALREAAERPPERCRIRIIEFSIQPDHLHLIVEANDEIDLAHGMRGLGVRLARAVNRALDRRGSYCLIYVLRNAAKHAGDAGVIDPCSSARWFEGFDAPTPRPRRPAPVHRASTWLLAVGWKQRWGPIRAHEAPRGAPFADGPQPARPPG
jgi:hypothetical protein